MKINFRFGATTALLALALSAAGSKAFAYGCRCAWAYGGQRPAASNIWNAADATAADGCARQQECVGLCNRPGGIAQSDAAGAAAVASACSARGLTSGQAVNVYFEAQAGDVVGSQNALRGCTGWQNANQTYTAQCPSTDAATSAPSPNAAVAPDTAANLARLRAQVRPWAIACADGTLTDDPVKDCGFADMTLFSGLSCAAGEQSRCAEVARSQDRRGRWWRSPKSVGSSAPSSFDRGAALGLLDYFLTLNETDHGAARAQAQSWIDWVQAHDGRACAAPADCSLSDDPALWPLVGQVMKALDVTVSNAASAEMDRDLPLQAPAMRAAADANAAGGDALHLVGVEIMLLNRLRREYDMVLLPDPSALAQKISSAQPMNPFFAYLAHGRAESVAQRVLTACPAIRPPATAPAGAHPYDWAWRRADSGAAASKSMGWDCVFMVDLLLGPAPVAPPTCADPQTLVNGLCRCPQGTSPSGANLAASRICACPGSNRVFLNGACADTTCPSGQTWNATSRGVLCCSPGTFDAANGGQCDVACPSDQVFNRGKNSCCPAGQILDAGGSCAPCPNNQVSKGVGVCGCPGTMLLQADATCACPTGSAADAANVCQCPAGQTMAADQCVTPAPPAVSASTSTAASPAVSADSSTAVSPAVSADTSAAVSASTSAATSPVVSTGTSTTP